MVSGSHLSLQAEVYSSLSDCKMFIDPLQCLLFINLFRKEMSLGFLVWTLNPALFDKSVMRVGN